MHANKQASKQANKQTKKQRNKQSNEQTKQDKTKPNKTEQNRTEKQTNKQQTHRSNNQPIESLIEWLIDCLAAWLTHWCTHINFLPLSACVTMTFPEEFYNIFPAVSVQIRWRFLRVLCVCVMDIAGEIVALKVQTRTGQVEVQLLNLEDSDFWFECIIPQHKGLLHFKGEIKFVHSQGMMLK